MISNALSEACSRRELFGHMATGLSGIALAHLLSGELHADARSLSANTDAPGRAAQAPNVEPRTPHFQPRAKSVIQLFMHGGPSQMDLLDPKPLLTKHAGRNFPGDIDVQQPEVAGGLLASPFAFAKYGESGIDVSELMPHLAGCVDDITVIRSMYTEHINHEPGLWMFHSGATRPGRPCIASWVVFGLGSENRDLPAFVVLDDEKGLPTNGIQNWSSGWLPPVYQGTRFRAQGVPLWNLDPHRSVSAAAVRGRQRLLAVIDRRHREARPGEAELDARIASYELAARMQLSASDALDLSTESKAIRSLYGLDDKITASYGRRCLMARRLIERGVRYVQLYIDGQIWDHHENLERDLRSSCARTDKPVGALLKDLKARGLLDETLVIWGGEFGRLPISQSKNGRDHNKDGFTIWMAGGGVKRGYIHGATDDYAYKAVENPVGVPEFHATVLHLLGLDHERLVHRRHGLDERLTGVAHPRVVDEIIA